MLDIGFLAECDFFKIVKTKEGHWEVTGGKSFRGEGCGPWEFSGRGENFDLALENARDSLVSARVVLAG